ncbi:MAG: UDP-N-acetylglucosamine 1-carboxyvinyltransferase [Hyphomonadaceae bacterium]|nr:UDP-N-acetylglucosamine 1-carboxyvinyltransferase [Hyphomonadaceae bacterium]
MDRIAITGGAPLKGSIPIYGAKNSALKLQAAALLSAEPLVLENMPDLADTRFMAQLLASLGVEVAWIKEARTLRLHAGAIASTIAPYDLVRKMRATFNVLGPLLARVGHATVSLPGGCAIGARPVDLHLKAFEAMGVDIHIEQGYVKAAALRGLRGADITFPFVSVGATEHAMLAAVLAQGDTTLRNAAREPEIVDLADCLNAMGARIEGAGTSEINIRGVTSLKGAKHRVVSDRIEAGTYALAVAAARGDVLLEGANYDHIAALAELMRRAGVEVETEARGVRVRRNGGRLLAQDFETEPFPGFPTDLQAQAMAVLCLADGQSRIRETIFENRFMHAPELARLGAQIAVHGNEAVVTGVEKLIGAPVMATDLRASVSLVIAGLAAEGETIVNRVYHLDRGFESLEAKLAACGAQIERQRGD